MHQSQFTVSTPGRGSVDLTTRVQRCVANCGLSKGLCHVFLHHTSASLMICENADPRVLQDLETFMGGLVAEDSDLYAHNAEGPDDMPAHIRSVLTGTSITVPVAGGRCDLGTWQGIFVWEHRDGPHRRRLTVTVQGEGDLRNLK